MAGRFNPPLSRPILQVREPRFGYPALHKSLGLPEGGLRGLETKGKNLLAQGGLQGDFESRATGVFWTKTSLPGVLF